MIGIFYSRFTLGGDIAMKGMLTKGLSLLALTGVLFAGVPSADALSINVYTNKTDWVNALSGSYMTENFNDATLQFRTELCVWLEWG